LPVNLLEIGGCHDNKVNDTWQNGTLHRRIKLMLIMLSVVILIFTMLSAIMLSFVMLNVVILSVFIFGVVFMSITMLSKTCKIYRMAFF
jgi:hypothetical protein